MMNSPPRAPALSKLRQESLAQQAFQEVKSAILSGSVAPGTTLSEIELAEAMGISRTPVREALAMLRSAGLIESVPGGGHIVRTLGPDEIRELFLVRETLECLALREFVSAASERSIPALDDIIGIQRRAHADLDTDAFLDADTEFHLTICRQAHLHQVAGLLASLRDKMRQAGLRAVAYPDRIPQVLQEHEAIVDALRAGDAEAAQQAMRSHLNATRRSLEVQLTFARQPEAATQGGSS